MIKIKHIWWFIIVIILFFNYYLFIFSTKIKSYCRWKILYTNTYDKNRSKIINYYFNLLNNLKIVYFLGFGSELGAIRNGGLIRRDHDIDIMIPIWLNYRIFMCNEYIYYFPTKCNIYSQKEAKVCNKTKHDYMIIFRNYIENIIRGKIDYNCRLWGKYGYTSCWILNKNNFFLDLWILIGNEYIYHNIKLCKCKFSNFITNCDENSKKNVYKMYGENWYIPIKRGSGEKHCNVILYPNNSNSILRYVV